MTCIIDWGNVMYRGDLGINGNCVYLRRHEDMRWIKPSQDSVFGEVL